MTKTTNPTNSIPKKTIDLPSPEQMPSLVFRNDGSSTLSTCFGFYNGRKWEWEQNVEIKNQVGTIDPESNYSPQLAEFRGRLFMVYKQKSGNTLYYTSFSGTSWAAEVTMPMQSNYTPALAVYDNKLFMVYKAKAKNDLYYAFFDGINWSAGMQIQPAGSKALESNYTPALAVHKNTLFMVHKGAHSNSLYYSSFFNGAWSGQENIDVAESNYTPSITVYDSNVFMVYNAKDSDKLYFAVFNGSHWSNGAQITVVGESKNPESNYTPSIAVYKNEVFMVYKGKSSNTLYHSTY